jgi:hypothetical protein
MTSPYVNRADNLVRTLSDHVSERIAAGLAGRKGAHVLALKRAWPAIMSGDRRRAPWVMRAYIAALLPAFLGGCMDEQTTTLGACTLESINRHFAQKPVIASNEVERCMRVQGYNLRTSRHCPYPPNETNPRCYQPDTWLGQIGYHIEMVIRSD